MAECLTTDSEEDFEDIKLDIIGNFVVTVESIICPIPLNIWQVPGAFQKVHSHVLKILSHGCKVDNKHNSLLWNFILGLRVLHPSLWPSTLFGSVDNKGSSSVCQWLTISLKNHLLSKQINTLVSESDRLSSYYHEWALMRCSKYLEAFIIALEALEKNSQPTLANINHSLMVCYYRNHKKGLLPEAYNFQDTLSKKRKGPPKSLPKVPEPPKPPSTIAQLVCSAANLTISSADLSIDRNTHQNNTLNSALLSSEEKLTNEVPNKISPIFFQVNYESSLPSDGERFTERIADDSLGDDGYSTVDVETLTSPSELLSPVQTSKVALPNMGNYKNNLQNRSENTKFSKAAEPSPFLLKFLTKSQNDIARRRSDGSIYAKSFIPSFLKQADQIPTESIGNSKFSRNNSSTRLCSSSFTKDSLDTFSSDAQKKISEDTKTPTNDVIRTHSRSRSDGSQPLKSFGSLIPSLIGEKSSLLNGDSYFDKSSGSLSSISSNVNWKPFMEDGGKSIIAEADGFFPCPKPGQNLIEFLSSEQFSKASAQLDRENAHFSVAEAMLAAVEKMNYRSSQVFPSKIQQSICDESEEDIAHNRKLERHKRRIRMRRPKIIHTETSDDDPVTTDYSMIESPDLSCTSDSESPISEIEKDQQAGYSDEFEMSLSNDPLSAENVAISLLSHYNKKLLPKADELQWLVSEQEVPQKLLPMPKSVAVSPDETETSDGKTLLRGTSEWAPPRPQLILTIHINKNRSAHLASQKWRCAGCGMKVSEKLSRHFRLCHYLGRYFCTTCHTNKKAVIPAKVLHKWDFKKYCVSNFSFELLNRMVNDPLFNIGALNPRLYRQSRALKQAHLYRVQLYHARVYTSTCSRAQKERAMLQGVPLHWSTEPQVYSLADLIAAKEKSFLAQIKMLTTLCISHISTCEVCLGQGFICELCRQGGPIFPYQLDNVTQCTKCRACYHFMCFSPVNSCIRCRRRERREKDEDRAPPGEGVNDRGAPGEGIRV